MTHQHAILALDPVSIGLIQRLNHPAICRAVDGLADLAQVVIRLDDVDTRPGRRGREGRSNQLGRRSLPGLGGPDSVVRELSRKPRQRGLALGRWRLWRRVGRLGNLDDRRRGRGFPLGRWVGGAGLRACDLIVVAPRRIRIPRSPRRRSLRGRRGVRRLGIRRAIRWTRCGPAPLP